MRNLLFFLLSLPLLLGGCQTLAERSDAQKLERTLESYGSAVRWQPLAGLYGFLQPDLQPAQPPAGLDNVRVTSYEVSVPPRQLSEGRVSQAAVIEFVLVDRQVVRTLVDNQLWVLSDEGQWQRANPIPAFR
jgi:hypothetical protein